jgi:hypothetical protein
MDHLRGKACNLYFLFLFKKIHLCLLHRSAYVKLRASTPCFRLNALNRLRGRAGGKLLQMCDLKTCMRPERVVELDPIGNCLVLVLPQLIERILYGSQYS